MREFEVGDSSVGINISKVIEIMIGNGLNQSISYSFVSPKVFDKVNIPADSELRNVVKIKNPLGEDFSVMRTTTIPSMMK